MGVGGVKGVFPWLLYSAGVGGCSEVRLSHASIKRVLIHTTTLPPPL